MEYWIGYMPRRPGYFRFGWVVKNGHPVNQGDHRFVADRDAILKILAALPPLPQMDGDVVGGHRLDAEPVRPFELKPVNADILPVGVVRAVRLAAYYDSFVNEAAAVVPI